MQLVSTNHNGTWTNRREDIGMTARNADDLGKRPELIL
jgi:hypothetical protein